MTTQDALGQIYLDLHVLSAFNRSITKSKEALGVLTAMAEENDALKQELHDTVTDAARFSARAEKAEAELDALKQDICSALGAFKNEGPRLAAMRVKAERDTAIAEVKNYDPLMRILAEAYAKGKEPK